MYIIGTSNSIAVPMVVKHAKQDAWLSSIISIGCGLLLGWLYIVLAKKYPNMTLIEYSEAIMGRWLGKTIAFFFFLFFLFITSGILRMIGDIITTKVLPETPIVATEITYLIIVIYAVRLGLEPFARTSEIVFPWVIMFFSLTGLFLFPQIKLENLLPFMENGFNPVLRGAFRLTSVPFSDLFLLLMITPFVGESKGVGRGFLLAITFSGFSILCTFLLSICVLGSDLTSRLQYPVYDLAVRIDVANFIQRIEVLSGGFIFITVFVKIVICFYAMAISLAQILNLKQYRFLTFPLGIMVLFLSILQYPNTIYFNKFVSGAWLPFSMIYGLFFPLLLLVGDKWKKRKHGSTRR
jgi:spore germination protein KB